MKDSTFGDQSPAQLYELKSQYLSALEMLDQQEVSLKSQLAGLADARATLLEHMRELDKQLAGTAGPKSPAKT